MIKKISKHIFVLAFIICCFAGIAVNAQAAETLDSGTCGENLTWTLDTEGTLTISGTGKMTDFDSWADTPWSSRRTMIETVDIEDGVTTIGYYAFSLCENLIAVNISDSVVTIEDSAFSYCNSLISLSIPGSVTSIEVCAFSECTNLTSVFIEDGVTSIKDCAFWHCPNLTSVCIPDSVTIIGDGAFNSCTKLSSMTIPDGVIDIGDYAFMNCSSLTTLTIPDSVTSIGKCAFGYCNNITSVIVSNSVTSIAEEAFYECGNLLSVTIPDSVTRIGNYAFYMCSSLNAVNIPDSVTSIGLSAFEQCSSLSSVTIENGVTRIGDHAFSQCTSLTSVTVPSSITSIDNYAFSGCINMNSVIIENGVTSISQGLFSGCSSLTSVTIPESVTNINQDAFSGCSSLTSVTIPDSVTSIGSAVFSGCSSLESITIPFVGDSRKTPSDTPQYPFGYVFGTSSYAGGTATKQYYYSSWTSPHTYSTYYIPSSLKSVTVTGGDILYGAFGRCKNLTSVTIGDGVTSVGLFAFEFCTNLTSVTLGNSITSIKNFAFSGCGSLTSIIFKGDEPAIGDSVFKDVTATAYYPNDNTTWADNTLQNYGGSVTWVKAIACAQCGEHVHGVIDTEGALRLFGTGETAAYDNGNNPSPFCHNADIRSIIIDEGITTIGDFMFDGCNGLTAVAISDTVNSIGDCVFRNCDNMTAVYINDIASWCNIVFMSDYSNPLCYGHNLYLDEELVTELQIPYGVTAISNFAFSNCNSITSVVIPKSVTDIGVGAFRFCVNLKTTEIPESVTNIGGYAFAGCGNLDSIVVRGNITNINNSTFYGCDSLTSVAIPDSVTSIGNSAFRGCTSLTSVTLPPNIEYVYVWSFAECLALRNVYFTGSAPVFENDTFYNVTATAYYPANNETWKESVMRNYGGTITWVKNDPVKITAQPVSKTVKDGAMAKFTVKATGNNLKYQWQYRTSSSGSWKNVSAASGKTANYSLTAAVRHHGYQYRCKITDSAGNTVTTKVVKLYVVGIKTQPASKTVKAGATVKFTVVATGNGLTYQWQYKTASTGSWKNVSVASGKTANYSLTAAARHNGYQYRCCVTDSAGNKVYSKTVTLNVLAIKTQPVSKTVVAGKTAKFTVSATGKNLKYQWQYRTASTGSWKNVSASSGKTANYSLTTAVRHHGYQYRCKVTDSAGNTVYTNTVNLYVLGIKTQPANRTVKFGATAKFTVKAIGKGLTYQWQYKTSSKGSWKNVSAASGKTANYSMTAAARHNGYLYRCKITDSAGNVIYTKTVKLTVQ